MRLFVCAPAPRLFKPRFLSLLGLQPLWVLCGTLLILMRPVWAEGLTLVEEKGLAQASSQQGDARYQLLSPMAVPPFAADANNAPELSLVSLSPELSNKVAMYEWGSRYNAVHHHLHEAASRHDIDLALLQALVATESGFEVDAVSPQGAVGLMQLMPATARLLGLKGDPRASLQRKLSDPSLNLQMGSGYLRYLINLFPGQIELALAAYNAGEGTVKRAGNRLGGLKKTTQRYVQKVMQLYGQLKPANPGLTLRVAPALSPFPIQSPE